MTLKPRQSEWTFLGEVCKSISFGLTQSSENIYATDSHIYATQPLSHVIGITFDHSTQQKRISIQFDNCRHKSNFKIIFPEGSQVEFYSTDFYEDYWNCESYEDITNSSLDTITISYLCFLPGITNEYQNIEDHLNDFPPNDDGSIGPYVLRFCTSGDHFNYQ